MLTINRRFAFASVFNVLKRTAGSNNLLGFCLINPHAHLRVILQRSWLEEKLKTRPLYLPHCLVISLQCFDAVGWVTGIGSGL